jgi:hypothetical protein
MKGEVRGWWPDPNRDAPPVDGSEIRATKFLRCDSGLGANYAFASLFHHSWGYAAAEVDELLRQAAAELDAGRFAGPLIDNATFQRTRSGPRYDIDAVDWFLGQLPHRLGHADRAGPGPDPWQDLAVAQLTQSKTRAPGRQPKPGSDFFRSECETARRDFGQQPGTHLQYTRNPWTGVNELRTAEEQQPIASLKGASLGGGPVRTTVSVGGRTFTNKSPKIPAQRTGDAWPPGFADLAASSCRDGAGHFAAEKMSSRHQRLEARTVRGFTDETGTPILYSHGSNFYRRAYARITFPDQRWLRFLVRGTSRKNAVMTAVDQAGNKVARYRDTRLMPAGTVEITVHPDRQLTDELVLAVAVSAPWLVSYFVNPSWGGGGG